MFIFPCVHPTMWMSPLYVGSFRGYVTSVCIFLHVHIPQYVCLFLWMSPPCVYHFRLYTPMCTLHFNVYTLHCIYTRSCEQHTPPFLHLTVCTLDCVYTQTCIHSAVCILNRVCFRPCIHSTVCIFYHVYNPLHCMTVCVLQYYWPCWTWLLDGLSLVCPHRRNVRYIHTDK